MAVVRSLLERFDQVHFFDLAPNYRQNLRDASTTVMELRVGDRSARVLNYGVRKQEATVLHLDKPVSNTQEALFDLADEIDRAVRVDQWIGTPEERMDLRDTFREQFGYGWPGRTKRSSK